MDPQPSPSRPRENLTRTSSITDHFPPMHSLNLYANDLNAFFMNSAQISQQNDQEETVAHRQPNLRSGFENLTSTREAQTLLSISWNVLPFFLLFSIKFFYDNSYEIFQFLLLYGVFFQSDCYIQKTAAGGFRMKLFQVVYCFVLSLLTVYYLQTYWLDDFEFSQAFGLNIFYFTSGEFERLSISSTLHGVIVVDTSFKLITVLPKATLLAVPESFKSSSMQRKIFQSLEYCSQLYRCALPVGPWLRYFLFMTPGSIVIIYLFCLVYISIKVTEMYRYSILVKQSVKALFSSSSFGSIVNKPDYKNEQCIVCHEDLIQPVKLECSHVFCKVCIETWLDQQTTCPMCRAQVAKAVDNDWKNGGTSRALRMF